MSKLKRSRLIIGLVVIVFCGIFVVWRAAFYVPRPEAAEKGVGREVAAEPNKPGEVQKPTEPNEPGEPNKPGEKPSEPNEPNEPKEQLENLNLKDVEMKDMIDRLAEWTGKVIIPVDDAMKQKITIYSKEPLPRGQALSLIYSALREKGIVAEARGNALILRPIKDAKLRSVPTVPADYELAQLENKDEIVQKFFKLKYYSPTQLQQVIQPLMPEYGYVSAIESTSHLVAIDTVANLLRIQRIIDQLDVAETEETVIETFEIEEGDPVEIVDLLNILLGDGQVSQSKRSSGNPARGSARGSDRGRDRREGRESKEAPKKEGGGPAPSVVIGRTKGPITLIPVPQRKWIIAKASAEDMIQIKEWIDKLDQKKEKPEEKEYTLRPIEHADVSEVATHINSILQQAPGGLRANVMVQPLVQDRKIMIIGSAENREMVEQMIADIDKPSEKFETQDFLLKHADPEEIKANIEDLYSEFYTYERTSRSYGSYRYRYSRARGPADPDMVKVYAFPLLKQVTVMCSKENMKTIAEQIDKWDRPIDVNDVLPKIISLENSDPVKMARLLTNLFTEVEQGRRSFFDILYGGSRDRKTIVGPLYGQMSFEAVEDTKKIIVQSKIPEGYAVVEKLVAELDKQEMAEVPRVVPLEYADPEDLSERLNAIFNEPGTVARIRLRERGLRQTGMEETESDEGTSDQDSSTQGEYTPPWSGSGARPRLGEMPLSNVIGRIRFVPDPRSKAILVLAPSEFMDSIVEMIKDLDIPGKQVRIKAIVVELNHSDATSLGLQLASSEDTFGVLEENALTALAALTDLESFGSVTLEPINVAALVDLLVKKMNGRILNQQTLWTKDNEEADFFKGKTVPFITSESTSAEGGRDIKQYQFPLVGMTLRVRPNITPQKNVDMNVDLTISQLTGETVNEQPIRTYMNTTTTSIVQDGQTIMLGGILFQQESSVEKKLALLGDLPLLGGLFRHTETVESNNELIIFITPEVIGDEDMLAETAEAEEKLEGLLGESEGEKPKGSG